MVHGLEVHCWLFNLDFETWWQWGLEVIFSRCQWFPQLEAETFFNEWSEGAGYDIAIRWYIIQKTCKSKAQYTKIRTNEDNLRPKKHKYTWTTWRPRYYSISPRWLVFQNPLSLLFDGMIKQRSLTQRNHPRELSWAEHLASRLYLYTPYCPTISVWSSHQSCRYWGIVSRRRQGWRQLRRQSRGPQIGHLSLACENYDWCMVNESTNNCTSTTKRSDAFE